MDVAGKDENRPDTIIVPDSVSNDWAPGAEILITSSTGMWNDHQVRIIENIERDLSYIRHVRIRLTQTFERPITGRISPDFAVEVALLSRDIVFESEDYLSSNGGHFWVKNTPNVVQIIVGIDIRYFGQQVRKESMINKRSLSSLSV